MKPLHSNPSYLNELIDRYHGLIKAEYEDSLSDLVARRRALLKAISLLDEAKSYLHGGSVENAPQGKRKERLAATERLIRKAEEKMREAGIAI